MRQLVYNAVLTLLRWPAWWWLRRHPEHWPLTARFQPEVPCQSGRPLWLQACSVGEVNTIRPLVTALEARYPDQPLLITTATQAGMAAVRERFGEGRVAWFPFDTRGAVRHFLDQANPVMLVLAETELWPNTIAACEQRGIPVVLVNGRLSDKHLHRYRRYRWWYRPLVRGITRAGMQSAEHAQRLTDLGAETAVVRVTGNLKFDAVRDHVPNRERQRVRSENGFTPDGRVLVFASTRPGDEALASACWTTLREEYPDLALVIAPRHVERADEVVDLFSEPVCRRTQVRAGVRVPRSRVFLLDTLGELSSFLSFASVSVVGGSFYPGVNGHNPLEAAALGVPVVFGPYMRNFAEAAAVLVERRGARQVACPEDLYLTLSELLADAAERRQMGTRARKAVLDHQGAVKNTVDLIGEVVQTAGIGTPAAISATPGESQG